MKKDLSSLLKKVVMYVVTNLVAFFSLYHFMIFLFKDYAIDFIGITIICCIFAVMFLLFVTTTIFNEKLKEQRMTAIAIIANIMAFGLTVNIIKPSFLSVLLVIGAGIAAFAIIPTTQAGLSRKSKINKKEAYFVFIAEFILIAFPIFLVNFFLANPLSVIFSTGLSFIILGITTLVLLYDILVAEHGFSFIPGVIAILAAIMIEIFAGYCNPVCGMIIALWIVGIGIAMIYEIFSAIEQVTCWD